jgi:hypothetical protein
MEENVVEETKKPKKKGLIKFLIFVVILGAIVLSLGFIFPGLLWTKSLGITYTETDYKSIMSKLEYIKDEVPTLDSADKYTYVYGEVKNIDVEFTSEEITAFFNENRPDYYAVKNVQVKINNDGTIEAVGNANVDYFLNEVLGGKYSRDQIKNEIPALGLLPSSVNLYLNFGGSVINNRANISINSVAVQGITIPSSYVKSNEAIGTVTEGIENLMSNYNTKSGSSFDKIAVENSKIVFKGKVPSSLDRTEN